jgi:hypothetical protein
MRRLFVLLTLPIASAQQPPSWLIPYPGAQNVTHTSLEGRTEVTYTTDQKPDEVVSHYRGLITSARLPFVASFNGIGTSIRLAVAQCDLLINVREQAAGTAARVSCATKSTNSAISVKTVEVPAQQGDEYTRRILAEAEAKHKKRIDAMKTYDQPVDARVRKKRAEK